VALADRDVRISHICEGARWIVARETLERGR